MLHYAVVTPHFVLFSAPQVSAEELADVTPAEEDVVSDMPPTDESEGE